MAENDSAFTNKLTEINTTHKVHEIKCHVDNSSRREYMESEWWLEMETFHTVNIELSSYYTPFLSDKLLLEQQNAWSNICVIMECNDQLVQTYEHLSLALLQPTDCMLWICLLLSARAWCSYKLCNYNLCINDSEEYLRNVDNFEEQNDVNAMYIITLDVHKLLIISLILCSEYDDTETLITNAFNLIESLLENSVMTEGERQKIIQYRNDFASIKKCIEPVRLVRHFCNHEKNWNSALSCSSHANWFFAHTTLCMLQAKVLYHCKKFTQARKLLLTFIPTLPPPLYADDAQRTSRQVKELSINSTREYLYASTLLAEVSYQLGWAYINITAVLLNRCLQINPLHADAIKIANCLLAYEEVFNDIYKLCAYREYKKLVTTITSALDVDVYNDGYNALLYRYLAEAHYKLASYSETIDACNNCLSRVVDMVEAYFLRSSAFAKLHQFVESKADLNIVARLTSHDEFYERKLCPLLDHEQFCVNRLEESEMYAVHGMELRKYPQTVSAIPYPNRNCKLESTSKTLRELITSQMRHARTMYEILGVWPSASSAEVRQAFRRRALLFHPDRLIDASENERKLAETMFKKLNEAHNILCDKLHC